ncbi:hypothetical protein DFJ74DRAFT_91450 [Hyaloraphidium curvatum]|nr:hypothetical protein DFJ74DRAFT_91450 [Hyaloraphidium curvatum]
MANNPRELSNLLLEVAVFLTTAEEASRVLNPAEMELWTLIRDASVHSRAVLGGLFLRKQRPMRVPILLESLAARGIPVPDAVLEAYDAQLLELGLYSVHKSESLGRLLEHLRVPELKAMARGTKMGTGAKKKEDYIAHLCKMAANQKHLIKGTDGNIRLSLGRRERSGPYWEEAKSLIGLLVSIPGPVFAAMHTGLSVFFRPSPFAYAASLADPKHSPLKFAHMAVTQVKGFAMPPGRVTPGARSEDWWREGREGFDAWAEASKVAFDIGKLVEQRTEEAYAEAVELLSVEVLAEWRAEVKRVGDTEPDDWREAWRRGCTEKGAVLTELVTLLAALHASLGDAESQCEVLQELLEQGAFGHSHRGRWFNDLTRVLQGNKRRLPEHAYEWVRAALDEEREGIWASRGGRRRELLKRAALLEVQLDVPIEDALVDHEAGFFEAPKRIINSGVNYFGNGEWEGGVSVEQVAMDWFSDHGNWVGVHAENSVIGLIFCLLALDVLFPPGAEDSPVDALPHQYGRHPADLFSVPGPLFFQNRGHLVAPWIEQIRATGVELVIARDRMLRERHCMPVGIGAWKRVPQECVVGVCRALGNERLAKLCEAIVETGWRSRCGGFPDLTLWKYDHVKDKYHVLFSEVKGPGDQLSETQQVWIETLLRIGCDAEVSHVLAKNDVDGNYC